MFSGRALSSCRCRPLSSNVMPQKSRPGSPPLIDLQRSHECGSMEGWWGRAAALVEYETEGPASCFRPCGSSGRGFRTIMFVGPAALAASWREGGGVARRSESVAQQRAGHSAGSQSSSLGRPRTGALVSFGLGRGGRLAGQGRSASALPEVCSPCEAGKEHLARRCWLMHNTSLKRSAIGRPPVPGLLHKVHFYRPGPVVLPLSSA
jgi:hypothetical protein